MIQARLEGGDKRWYQPARDMAYAWQQIFQATCEQLPEQKWDPWLRDLFKQAGVTSENLGTGAKALAAFFMMAGTDPVDGGDKSLRKTLKDSGWFDLPAGVQMAICCKIGQAFMCMSYVAIEDVMQDGKHPFDEVRAYRAAAQAAEALQDRSWRRWLKLRWRRFKEKVLGWRTETPDVLGRTRN